MPRDDEQKEVMGAVHAFLHSEDWSEARQVYIQNEELLSLPIVETIFMQYINHTKDARMRNDLQAQLDRIRRAKSEGIAAAFAENPLLSDAPDDPEE
jgi:hypothetical protein